MNQILSADHEDSLKELLNISMGQAACKLAMLSNHPVTLTVPSVDLASPERLMEMFGDLDEYYFTRQPFFGQMAGEVITQLTKQGGELSRVSCLLLTMRTRWIVKHLKTAYWRSQTFCQAQA